MNTRKKLSLGEFIKAHRLGESITQTKFAAYLGISRQRLCDLESNWGNVSIKLCKALAKKLDLPAQWPVKLSLQQQLRAEGIKLKIAI